MEGQPLTSPAAFHAIRMCKMKDTGAEFILLLLRMRTGVHHFTELLHDKSVCQKPRLSSLPLVHQKTGDLGDTASILRDRRQCHRL